MWLVLLLAAGVLTAAAISRSAEYDEQYTLFLTSGTPRPIWPETPVQVETIRKAQSGAAGLMQIATDLRRTDVHPPLYFWTASLWRRLVGDTLFGVRVLSIVFALGALCAVGAIARRTGAPPALAMLLTLGCYSFVYTGVIARGFALAQLLTLLGVMFAIDDRRERRAALPARTVLAGALFGAAVLTNYLAVFVAIAVMAWLLFARGWRLALPCFGAFGAFAPVWLWFFLAQRGSREGQFPSFELGAALLRLARYSVASVLGGLPLYVNGSAQTAVTAGLALLSIAAAGLVALRWRRAGSHRLMLGAAALAPPAGLIALGLVFGNTPIELRYLGFAAPFVAVLLASTLPRIAVLTFLGVQALGLAGSIVRPETMQPARAAALAAASGHGLVLAPHGNDGVGIVGAFAQEARGEMTVLIVRSDITPDNLQARIASWPRVSLAAMAQDDASRAAIGVIRAVLRTPCWRPISETGNFSAYERVCAPEQVQRPAPETAFRP